MNKDTDMLIIGGGLAGLSAGCYARMNGWSARILEHNLELGGVCTAWRRDDYLIDGCIQWLMGAGRGDSFRRVYEELGVLRDVELRTIERFHRYEDPADERVVELTCDAGAYRDDLVRLSRADEREIDRLLEAAEGTLDMPWPVDKPPQLASVLDRLRALWEVRSLAGTLLHFRGSVGDWCERNLKGAALRRYFVSVLDPEMPMILLPFLLKNVIDGAMTRPVGGSAAFRDAIVRRYFELGGEASVHTTVEEILVENDRAIGVRLTDGTQLRAEHVVSTASQHETLLRLLGGRYLDRAARSRLDDWKTFAPIVLFSAGVALPLDDAPPTLVIRQREPLHVGGAGADTLNLRVYNDDPSFAPEDHCVVQALVTTDYDWWAERGSEYPTAKRRVADELLGRIERRLPGVTDAVRMTDLATPLTFWRHTRSWRGAYEGWLPTSETLRSRVPKSAAGLSNLHFAGQWVEPGGGVPPALASGRQLVQILCRENGRDFTSSVPW